MEDPSALIDEEIVESDAEIGDSDVEMFDSKEFTSTRLFNKMQRYQKRSVDEDDTSNKICEEISNKSVIDEFKMWLKRRYLMPTYRLTCGYLFNYTHITSFLTFMTNKDTKFSFTRNVEFCSESFLELEGPLDWLYSLAGDNGQEKVNHR